MVRWRQDAAAEETGSEENIRRSEGLYISRTPSTTAKCDPVDPAELNAKKRRGAAQAFIDLRHSDTIVFHGRNHRDGGLQGKAFETNPHLSWTECDATSAELWRC